MADFASVYGLANRPTTELANPMDIYGKMQGIKANQMALEDQQAKRKMAEDARNLFKEAGGDFRKAATMASERGMIEHAEKFGSVADAHDTEVAKAREAASKMTAQQRADTLTRIQEVGKFSKWVLSQPPEKQQQAFDMGASQLGQFIPEIGAMAGQPVDADRLMLMASQMDAFGSALQGAKWSQPFKGVDPKTGKMTFVQQDEAGNLRAVSDFAPPPDKPSVVVNTGGRETFKDTSTLRGEYNSEIKGFRGVKDAYKRILSAAEEQTAASDISLIYGYMKLLDPGSVVREGEFATAQNAAGIPDRIRAAYNKAVNGERLSGATREGFLSQAKKIYGKAEESQKQVANRYTKIASSYGLDPSLVVTDETEDMPKPPKPEGQGGAKTADDLLKMLGK